MWAFPPTVDSNKLEPGFRLIYTGVPSFSCFGIRGRSYSNFLASTVLSGHVLDVLLDIHVDLFVCASIQVVF